MRFVLTIDIGNEAMTTAGDIANALRKTSQLIREGGYSHTPAVGDSGPILDDNGNRCGSWHVDGGR